MTKKQQLENTNTNHIMIIKIEKEKNLTQTKRCTKYVLPKMQKNNLKFSAVWKYVKTMKTKFYKKKVETVELLAPWRKYHAEKAQYWVSQILVKKKLKYWGFNKFSFWQTKTQNLWKS